MRSNKASADGVLDRALKTRTREEFLKHNERQKVYAHEAAELAEMRAYIQSDDLVSDIERLKRGDMFFSAPFHYRIPKSYTGKKRDIYVLKGRELYLLKLISWLIHDHDHMFSEGLYSFRREVHAKHFLFRMREFDGLDSCYIVKADVSDYVRSIVPELILPILEELWADDPDLLRVFRFLLLRRECIERDGTVQKCEPGGLGGLPVSNYFMNVYLMEMDRYFVKRSPLYCRYSDDVIILAKDRAEAEEFQRQFLGFLERYRLRTNPDKTFIIPPGGRVDILGYSLNQGKIDISRHAMDKYERKIRLRAVKILKLKRKERLEDWEAGRLLIDYYNLIFYAANTPRELCWVRWYFPVITTTDGLKELDHYVQDSIRYVMSGGISKKRYRVRYDRLRSLGYRSLVYSYYHFLSEKMTFDDLYETENGINIRNMLKK